MTTMREQLLHPATVIACAALATALAGTTYAAASIGTSQLRNGSVVTAKLRDGAVTTGKLRNGAVTPAKLAAGSVTARRIAPAAVTGTAIAAGAVGAGHFGRSAVTPPAIAAGAVGTDALADGSVTAGKIAAGAVTGAQIAPGTIGADDIAPDQVVTGRGALHSTRVDVIPHGQTKDVLTLPHMGTLSASCSNGGATTTFLNTSEYTAEVVDWGVTGGAPDTAFLERMHPWPGASVDAADPAGSAQAVTWQISYRDAGGAPHVATIQVTSGSYGTACQVTAQAVSTG